MGRYVVEFKAFQTGNWYVKTSTDNIGSAYSVAQCSSYGRAYRVSDSKTGRTLLEHDEDARMAVCARYPNGNLWWWK